MKIFILEPVDPYDSMWTGYDLFDGFVIQAEDEKQARGIADANGADENLFQRPWLSDEYTTCKELVAGDGPGVILSSFNAG